MGQPDRPRQAAGHRPLLRHLQQPHRRLPRVDRPVVDRPGHGRGLRDGLPAAGHGRLRDRAPCPARPPRGEAAARGAGRIPRRHAGAAVVAGPPRGHGPRRHRRRLEPPDRPEHRLLGRGPTGDHGRPALPRRALRPGGDQPRRRPLHRPDDGPHHLPVRGRLHREVRAFPPGGDHQRWLRDRLRRRELPRPPGPGVPRALRCAQLPLPDPRHGLLRPVLQARRADRARGVPGAVPRAQLRHRLAVLDRALAADRPPPGERPAAGDVPRVALPVRPRLLPAGRPRLPRHAARVVRPRLEVGT